MAVDLNGNLYVADTENHTIRKVPEAGEVTTLAGLAGTNGITDGAGSAARFYYPSGLAVDGNGTLFVADQINNLIPKVTDSGVVTTLGGAFYVFGGADGLGSTANFYYPTGIAVAPEGKVYVSDWSNHRIVKGTPAVAPSVELSSPDGLGNSSATLQGTVNPNSLGTTAHFEYGLTTSYGSSVSVIPSPDDDSTLHQVSTELTGLAAGTLYHCRVSATNAAGTSHTADETFTTLTAHQAWRQHHFGTPTNAGEAADSFDYDHDGLVNLLEYAFGLDPKEGTSAQLPSGQMLGAHFVLSFSQPAGVAGISYGAEWSPSMAGSSWTPVPDTGHGGSHTFSVAIEGNPTVFMRFRITVP